MIFNIDKNYLFVMVGFNLRALVFLLLPALSYGEDIVLWEAGYDYVAMSSSDTRRGIENDHPVEISPKEIYSLLASIQITESDNSFIDLDALNPFSDDEEEGGENEVTDNESDFESIENALFNKIELRKLSRPIAKGLAKARTDEDIIFSISGRHDNYLGKSQKTTTARLFYQGGQLHLIFGEVYVDFEKKYRRKGNTSTVAEKASMQELKKFKLKVGSRKKVSKLPVRFVRTHTHFLQTNNGKVRKDWLRIDVNKFKHELDERQNRQTKRENMVEKTGQLQQKTQEINQEQEQLKQKVERLERVIEAREKASSRSNKTDSRIENKSLEDRLSELKQIYERGHISEELYNEKVREILKAL